MPRGAGSDQGSSSHGGFSAHTSSGGSSGSFSGGSSGGSFGGGGSHSIWDNEPFHGSWDRPLGPIGHLGKGFYIFITVLAVVAIGMFLGIMRDGGVMDDTITKSTIGRQRLAEELCTPSDRWYQDDWGDWLDTIFTADRETLAEGQRYFYERTGVQPFIWITGEEGADIQTVEQLQRAAERKYEELFADRGHLLIIFREYPNGSGNYLSGCFAGADAETVMDAEAREILLDYIDAYYPEVSYSESEMFAKALKNTAGAIMKVSLTTAQIAMICVGVLIVAVAAVLVVVNLRRKKAAQARKRMADFNILRHEEEMARREMAVSCPHCGATTKIRRGTVGQCMFCGTYIRVTREGKAEITSTQTK